MTANAYAWINQSLATIHQANWYRQVKTIQGHPGAIIQLEGRSLINFASNDYLGLAGDERLAKAAIEAIQEYGTGATGSRLLSGHRDLHDKLERAIADFKRTESALVFSSGYLANLGTIKALVDRRDLILADQNNHSSLKNGAKLSGATILNYSHLNLTALEAQLQKERSQYRRCLIITDSVFSMDGHLCPLLDLTKLAENYDCMLLIDDAHATGVMGKTGSGVVEYFGCRETPIIQIGTLSKALGSLGGYVAGNANLIDFLRNRAATWIYSTGLSPADTAAALKAIAIIQQEPDLLSQLWNNIKSFKQKLSNFNLLPSESAIICVPIQDVSTSLKVAQQLLDNGIFAPAIRPPTVATSRIRFSVMATHKPQHFQKLVGVLDSLTR